MWMTHRWICACGYTAWTGVLVRQSVHTEKQDILHAAVLQVIEHPPQNFEVSLAPTVMLVFSYSLPL